MDDGENGHRGGSCVLSARKIKYFGFGLTDLKIPRCPTTRWRWFPKSTLCVADMWILFTFYHASLTNGEYFCSDHNTFHLYNKNRATLISVTSWSSRKASHQSLVKTMKIVNGKMQLLIWKKPLAKIMFQICWHCNYSDIWKLTCTNTNK